MLLISLESQIPLLSKGLMMSLNVGAEDAVAKVNVVEHQVLINCND
jgi:hypothetical protein